MKKIILIDAGSLSFRAIFSWELNYKRQKENSQGFTLPSDYTYFSMIISVLKKIGVNKDDTIILALEGKSWRKSYLSTYKAQRREQREKHELIDWGYHFNKINELNETLKYATNFHVLRLNNCEADDIISGACRYFKDNECVIITADKDLYQLAYLPNVKIFSLNKKCKGSKGMYIIIDEPLKIILDKAKKGDISDNIIPDVNDTEEDYNLRYELVNLLKLPDFVEQPIFELLKNLPEKIGNPEYLPFPNSLAKKFPNIYESNNILTSEYCQSLENKRIIKRKNKKKKGE